MIYKYLLIIIPSLVIELSMIYIWHDLLNKKVNFKDYKLYVAIIFELIIAITNHFVTSSFVRVVLICIVSMIFIRYLLKTNIQKTILIPILYEIVIMISEIIYSIVFLILKLDVNIMTTNLIANMLSNVFIALVSILIFKMKIIKKIYNKILKMTDRIKTYQLLLLCLIIMFITNILWANAYYKIDFIYMFIFNLIIVLFCFILILYYFRTQNKYNKVTDKYNIAIKSLNDYEDMMNKYRINNHENKNLLLSVRAMILNKEKDIPKYIDSMIKNRYKDDEELLFKMTSIPSGGLKATIYTEILKIKEKKIKYALNIDKQIRNEDLIKLDTNDTIDLCKIVGVFIDNAIEAVSRLKTKNIDINIYKENKKICLQVSNNYNGFIDTNKISKFGYTTKGKNHGYGLSLVKDIINKSNKFENKTKISKNLFTQILIINNLD